MNNENESIAMTVAGDVIPCDVDWDNDDNDVVTRTCASCKFRAVCVTCGDDIDMHYQTDVVVDVKRNHITILRYFPLPDIVHYDVTDKWILTFARPVSLWKLTKWWDDMNNEHDVHIRDIDNCPRCGAKLEISATLCPDCVHVAIVCTHCTVSYIRDVYTVTQMSGFETICKST